MTRHSKASSAGSTMRRAGRLGRSFPGALPRTSAAPATGSGAPRGRRFAVRLVLLSAVATLAFAATASAAPPEGEITTITPGFINANVEATSIPAGPKRTSAGSLQVRRQTPDRRIRKPVEEEPGVSQQCFFAEKKRNRTGQRLHAEHMQGGAELYEKLWIYNGGENEPVYTPKFAFSRKPVSFDHDGGLDHGSYRDDRHLRRHDRSERHIRPRE